MFVAIFYTFNLSCWRSPACGLVPEIFRGWVGRHCAGVERNSLKQPKVPASVSHICPLWIYQAGILVLSVPAPQWMHHGDLLIPPPEKLPSTATQLPRPISIHWDQLVRNHWQKEPGELTGPTADNIHATNLERQRINAIIQECSQSCLSKREGSVWIFKSQSLDRLAVSNRGKWCWCVPLSRSIPAKLSLDASTLTASFSAWFALQWAHNCRNFPDKKLIPRWKIHIFFLFWKQLGNLKAHLPLSPLSLSLSLEQEKLFLICFFFEWQLAVLSQSENILFFEKQLFTKLEILPVTNQKRQFVPTSD